MIMVNKPSSLSKVIKTPPGKRQTKLKEDLEQAMKNRSRSHEHDRVWETNTQFATQSGEIQKNVFASQRFSGMGETSAYPVPEVSGGPQRPGHKRKNPESSVLLSPPKTPPSFNQGPSPSSVNPLYQQAAGSKQPGGIPTQFDSTCKACKNPINRGVDEVKCVRKGANDYWIHASCELSDQM